MHEFLPWTLGQTMPSDPPPSAPGAPQTTTTTPGGTAAPTTQGAGARGGFDPSTLIFLVLMLAVFWFVLMGPQRKEKKRREAMLSALKKGDKVLTIGGEFGTVVEVRDHDVVLKVDENSNTRIRYSRSAIQAVVNEGEKAPS